MGVREITLLPDPVLRRKTRKVVDFDKDLQTLIDDMIETMRDAPGVGLAAPQVNVSSRLCVVEFVEEEDRDGEEEAPKRLYVLVNPEIVQASEEQVTGVEGCLSIPGLVGEVDRHEEIMIKALNRHGKPIKIKASGWLARIFQHEIDHLDGVLYVDRTDKIWKPREDEEALLAE